MVVKTANRTVTAQLSKCVAPWAFASESVLCVRLAGIVEMTSVAGRVPAPKAKTVSTGSA